MTGDFFISHDSIRLVNDRQIDIKQPGIYIVFIVKTKFFTKQRQLD